MLGKGREMSKGHTNVNRQLKVLKDKLDWKQKEIERLKKMVKALNRELRMKGK